MQKTIISLHGSGSHLMRALISSHVILGLHMKYLKWKRRGPGARSVLYSPTETSAEL